jgi:hypothetical protein
MLLSAFDEILSLKYLPFFSLLVGINLPEIKAKAAR